MRGVIPNAVRTPIAVVLCLVARGIVIVGAAGARATDLTRVHQPPHRQICYDVAGTPASDVAIADRGDRIFDTHHLFDSPLIFKCDNLFTSFSV